MEIEQHTNHNPRSLLYETDERKYAGPHPLQLTWPARLLRRWLKHHSYTQYSDVFTNVEVTGQSYLREINTAAIFIGNHTSHLDTVLTQTALPTAVTDRLLYGAAQDRWFLKGQKKKERHPLYQSFVLGTFPIKRGGGRAALSYASRVLERQHHVFLFPEGTRAARERLGRFKHGVALLAIQHQVPVVPLYLHGLAEIRPKGAPKARPGPVSLDILQPMNFDPSCTVEDATQALQDVMQRAHIKRNPTDEPTLSQLAA